MGALSVETGPESALQAVVTLYIAKEDGPERRTLRVSGRLAADGAGELETACGDPARLVIDLSELLSADETGTGLPVEVRQAGARLVAIPPFSQLLFYRQDTMVDRPVKLGIPFIISLFTDPREENPTADTWVVPRCSRSWGHSRPRRKTIR